MTAYQLAADITNRGQRTLTRKQAAYLHSLCERERTGGLHVGRRDVFYLYTQADASRLTEKGFRASDPVYRFAFSWSGACTVEKE